MHPRAFLDTYWRNDLRDEVFVAMSFADRFRERWERVFVPAIEGEPIGGRQLRAVRVDIRRSGDSILTEIADGIAHAQRVVADISVVDRWTGSDGRPRHERNGNVMYEVGLALGWRQPEDVVLVRDDDEPLLFDIASVPVLKIQTPDEGMTVQVVRRALADRFAERDLAKDLRVAATLEALSKFEVNVIRSNAHLQTFGWSGGSLPAAVAMALPELLRKRVLRLVPATVGAGTVAYTWTGLGRVVADQLTPPGPPV
jgi:hypothetical protein